MRTTTDREQQTVRMITARVLSRDAAILLDEVELEGARFVVTRLGRPVAVVGPVSGDLPIGGHLRRRVTGTPTREVTIGEPTEVPPDLQLDPVRERLLRAIAEAAPYPWSLNELSGEREPISSLAAALGGMELDGLVAKDHMGYRITRLGARVASEKT